MQGNLVKQSGFTLVELVMVIVLLGVLGAGLTSFLRPAVQSFADTRRRAELTDMADLALRQMAQDIRRAVPNSLIRHSQTCLQIVPTKGGGRYRMADDPAGGSAWLDTTAPVSQFDVLTPLTTGEIPAADDWIVIGNQNTGDVYAGINREQVSAVLTPGPANGLYEHRITLKTAKQFPEGYDGGRFLVVANNEQSVFYSCVIPSDGSTGRLYRTVAGFGATAASCSSTGALVATDVEQCVFTYNVGATQQSGLVWMQVQLLRDGERITLSRSTHVENAP